MTEENDRTHPQEPHKDYSEQDVQQRFETINKTMVESGLYAEAVEAYKELIRDYPGSRWAANAYLAIAHCYHALGQEEDELDVLEDILRQFPDHVATKRARGAIEALRERRGGEGPAGADLHGALRRLTRQVERMREGERRRAWLGAVVYIVVLVLLALTWSRAHMAGRPPAGEMRDLDRRVTALESAVKALSGGPAQAPARPGQQAPTVTVIPVEPPESKPPETSQKPPSPAKATGKAAPPPPAPARARGKPAPPASAGRTPAKASAPAKATRPPRTPVKPKPTPAPKPPAGGAPPGAKTYTVKEGDSLWVVARSQLGDARRVNEIARLNGLKPPYKVKAGTKLKLPAR